MNIYNHVVEYKLNRYKYCQLLSSQTVTFLFDLSKKNDFFNDLIPH